MKPKLFVGNLSYETTDEELKKLFSPYGEIASAVVIFDKKSGKSKGYGFVQMVESKDAAKALEISGQEFMGRDIIVTEAESPMDGEPRTRNRDRNSRSSSYDKSPRGRSSNGVAKKKSLWEKIFGIFFPKKQEEEKPKKNYSQNKNRNRRPNNNQRRSNGNRNSNPRGARRSFSS